ncbi:T9SS type A sorting domain-containing protein, partial [Rubrivirga sp.]|uniref:T9SS type A sorting domain-containing protein n=1 Tax=Rubrivirga sp. TaxID=1885344 RepID=UPI003C763D54
PNPATRRAFVTVRLPAPSAVTAKVFDALGRRVAVLHDGALGAGAHRFDLDVGGLAPGLYVVRSVWAGGAQSHPFAVVR